MACYIGRRKKMRKKEKEWNLVGRENKEKATRGGEVSENNKGEVKWMNTEEENKESRWNKGWRGRENVWVKNGETGGEMLEKREL